jgi:hypothetical protein
MRKRLITATLALAFAGLATPTLARPFNDHGPDFREQYYDSERRNRSYEADRDDDGERATRRSQRRQAGQRERRNRGTTERRARAPDLAARSMTRGVRSAGAGMSRTCLTGPTRALLGRIEAAFGTMQVISTCRPGARIAGSGRPSKHGSGQAVDFNAPGGRKGEVVRWLIANHKAGGVMTYAGMNHIHIDIGPRFVSLNSGGSRRR